MRSLMIFLAVMLAAGHVQAQSDETCIAYMEADAVYRRTIKPAIIRAIRAATIAERVHTAAAEATEKNARIAYDAEPSEARTDALNKARKAHHDAVLAQMKAMNAAAINMVDDRPVVSLRGRPPVAFLRDRGGCALGGGRAVSAHSRISGHYADVGRSGA